MTPEERTARDDLIVSLFLARNTGPQIARKMKLSAASVHSALWKAGLSGKDGGCSALKRHMEAVKERNRARRDLLRKHRFLNALYPPYPREASHASL